jgi:hypothetical protein
MRSLPPYQCGYVLLTANKVNQMKPDSTRQDVGKAVKYKVALCAVGGAGEKGTLDSILNLKYFQVRHPRCVFNNYFNVYNLTV